MGASASSAGGDRHRHRRGIGERICEGCNQPTPSRCRCKLPTDQELLASLSVPSKSKTTQRPASPTHSNSSSGLGGGGIDAALDAALADVMADVDVSKFKAAQHRRSSENPLKADVTTKPVPPAAAARRRESKQIESLKAEPSRTSMDSLLDAIERDMSG
eukprot:m.5558 g.5558  ORF g.5558 m.5558 type:complete len:160 (-) comp2524_c0_seq2:103-582(-)